MDFVKALRGEAMDRGPMFTYVPSHGATPHWLPPSMAVHDGDWKLIRTFYYGDNGDHQYRLYNLRKDIGENNNLATTHPKIVRELDTLIDAYIADAGVVTPQPNPQFDPSAFDASKIGVQPGGLKMPPSFPSSRKHKSPNSSRAPGKQPSLLGWVIKNAEANVDHDALHVLSSKRQRFIARAGLNAQGPVDVTLRIRTQDHGTGRLQWRTEGQNQFLAETTQSFDIPSGDWQELSIPLDVNGQLIHIRLFLPSSKQSIDIDWIEIHSKTKPSPAQMRWDF